MNKTRIRPNFAFMMSHPWHMISLGFGSGLSPIMPGTVGTVFGSISFHILTQQFPTIFTNITWYIICIVGFLLGVKTCQFTGDALNSPDSGHMVWDEIIAIWFILACMMPTTLLEEIAAFMLFRIFDMLKPPPIRWFDKNIHGGFGVMLDDVIAALFVIFSLMLYTKIIATFF